MKATDLYSRLEQNFVKPGMTDDWYKYMPELDEYLCDNFKQRSIGLMCDFAEEINKVYTAVFPSNNVINKILADGVHDAMLFVHHASDWDLAKIPGKAFHNVPTKLLEKLKEQRISLFCFHTPLDAFSEYSTSKTLADTLGITVEKPFHQYEGALVGVVGTTDCKDINELNTRYSQLVGHETKLYQYGNSTITKIGVVAGGGCDVAVMKDMAENGLDVLVTGIGRDVRTTEPHDLAKVHNINILGGTHYSSEKFACIAMCSYFAKLGLAVEFVNGEPCMVDL